MFMPQGALGDTTPHERMYGEPPSVRHLRALSAEDTNTDASAVMGFAYAVSDFYGFEPADYRQATSCAEQDKWRAAMDAEMAAMDRLNVFEYVRLLFEVCHSAPVVCACGNDGLVHPTNGCVQCFPQCRATC